MKSRRLETKRYVQKKQKELRQGKRCKETKRSPGHRVTGAALGNMAPKKT